MNKWDEVFQKNPKYKPLNEIFLDNLIKKIKKEINNNPKKVVDLGCGTGLALFQLARRGFNVVGIDFSEVALSRLQEEIDRTRLQNITFINHDLNDLPINLQADIFLCNLVYTFIRDKDGFLNRIAEFMSSDSVFIIFYPSYP